jgi:DNA-binding FadR family transcriptional regulator
MALLEVAGNRWAVQIVADLRKVMKLNRHHSLFKRGRLADSLAEHRALMAAIAARDGAAGPAADARALRARAGSGGLKRRR